tara:strand:+ start:4743 stop:7424 length:2682 start_codon:yes stop_codon:yes gene_type:complete
MAIKFDSNKQYQQDAIKSTIDLFKGQPSDDSSIPIQLNSTGQTSLINGVSNSLVLTDEQILANLQAIQKYNEIEISTSLETLNFSLEMETGTGKTYVYLRSIFELSKNYGFKKFVIVVPSVAIREGVVQSLKQTKDHFADLYEKVPVDFQVYDSKRVSNLRGFATNDSIQILVMNIDAFAKDQNIINRAHYRTNGQKPIEFIQSTNPIVIIDEPQNMETDNRKSAILKLNPLCTLRYSATLKNAYNLIYKLSPVDAYDLGLVKKIEVDSVIEENSMNDAFIQLHSIKSGKRSMSATISIMCNTSDGVKKKKITVSSENDLYSLSGKREIYKNNFIVSGFKNGKIKFSNGLSLSEGQAHGGLSETIMKAQIDRTVVNHLDKQLNMLEIGKDIKVLSLFFIDKVANYRAYDEAGNPILGKFGVWFEESYKKYIVQDEYKILKNHKLKDIHNGYFSKDKKGVLKDTKETTASQNSEDAQRAYKWIMEDKESILEFDNPLSFIFSHSALREGWDNPNVFQICTLNQTNSKMKKRQELGRGLRIPVEQINGDLVQYFNPQVNILTVVANESYEDFANTLQTEIEDECGVSFKGKVLNKKQKQKAEFRKGFKLDENFKAIWSKIRHKTKYSVDYETDELIARCVDKINEIEPIKEPKVRTRKATIKITNEGVEASNVIDEDTYKSEKTSWQIPNILDYIQYRTELSRSTIADILIQSERLQDVITNPQMFLDAVSNTINYTLNTLMIDGIKYQKISGIQYEMKEFQNSELEFYLNEYTFEVKESEKTIYETHIPLDSVTENTFAKDCESNKKVKFYFKLPYWFKIPTPIGSYNPDWAVVLNSDAKVYFIAETKNTGDERPDIKKLKPSEQQKIQCGRKHYENFDGVEYEVVEKVSHLID